MGKRFPKPVDPGNGPAPPGRFSFGTQTLGGPIYTDAFKARRAPTQISLGENYNALIYAMVNRSRDGVARVPMRLMADETLGDKPIGRTCRAIRVSRSTGMRLWRAGVVSEGAVGQISEVRNHPLLDVLDNPDPYGTFTREKLIGLLVSYMKVFGSGYLVPEGNGWDWTDPKPRIKGPPENLWLAYPQYVIPIRAGTSPIPARFQYFADSLPYQSVMWFRHDLSLKDAYGSAFSPTSAAEPYRQQEQELVSVLSQVMGIAPRPSIIATAKDALQGVTPKQKDDFARDLKSKFASYGAGGIHVNDGAWEFTIPDYPKADVGAKEIAEHDRDNLANIFGAPPTYFTKDSNLANLQAADIQFARANTEPMCKTVAAQFTRLAKMCDPRLFFAHDPVLEDNDLEQAQVDKIYIDMGAVTINELNEEKKYKPKPWGDVPFLPGTLVPADVLMQQAQQSMQQAQEQHEAGLEQGKQSIESGAQGDEIAADAHEHGKEMDKAKLKIDAAKAKAKPAAQRSVDERLILSIEAMERSLTEMGVAV